MALKAKNRTEDTTTTEANNTSTTTEETAGATTQETGLAVKQSAGAVAPVMGSSMFITNPDFLDAVADAEYGTFVSIVASNGTHMVSGKDTDLGKVLKFQGILAKKSWKIVPGSNDEEAKDYFAVSNDGETVNDGRTLDEALDDAIQAGYEKASIKEYLDVICMVVDCENEDFIGETVTLQLAPSSQYSWKPLAGKCKMKAATGKLEAVPILGDPDLGSAVVFTSTATPTVYKSNSFTKFVFSI